MADQEDYSALENWWSDLHALKKLYGLLQHTPTEDVPLGEEIKDELDEKSRHLLRKLLDGATQQALQHQVQIVSCEAHHLQRHASQATPQLQEPWLVLRPHVDERNPKGYKVAENLAECPPPPPPKHSLPISHSGSAAEPQTEEQNRRPSCDLKRLNSATSTTSLLLLRDHKKKKTKKLLETSSSTRRLSHRCRPTHHDHPDRSSMSKEHPCGVPAMKSSRRGRLVAVEMSPSHAAMKSAQERRWLEAAADRRVPMTSTISHRFDDDSAGVKLAGGVLGKDVNAKNPPLPVVVKAKEPQPSNQVNKKTDDEREQVRREKPPSHRTKRSNQSYDGTESGRQQQRQQLTLPSIRHAKKANKMKRSGEAELGVSHRRKLPPGASSRKTYGQSSEYTPSSTTHSSDPTKTSQLGSRIQSIAPPLRVTSHRGMLAANRTVPGRNRRPAKHGPQPLTNEKRPRRSLSRHHRAATAGTTRWDRPKEPKRQEGRLRRFKNKLSIIFHHHHHHLDHGQVGGDNSSEGGGREQRHRSPWEYIWSITHRTRQTDEVGRRAPCERRQHGHLLALLGGLIRHVLVLGRRKRRKTALSHHGVRLRKVRWWRRHARSGGKKPRLRLGIGRTKQSSESRGKPDPGNRTL